MVDLTGERAISEDEIAGMDDNRVPQAFTSFETTAGIAVQLFHLVANNLGDDRYASLVNESKTVSKDDVDRVARQYFKPELMTILVVGDRAKIEGPLKSLPFVKAIQLLDVDGNPIPASKVERQALR